MRRSEIKNIIEAILFSYADPISVYELNMAINEELSPKEIQYMLDTLIDEYRENDRGIQIKRINDKYQMCSNIEYKDYIKKVLEPARKRKLTNSTLETLVIIGYNQPITKNEIEAIRGVKCDKALKTLLDADLIYESGRLDKLGKPILYKTTDEFLKILDIENISQLPKIEDIDVD